MNGLPYYPRYPRDLIEGTLGMTFEEKTTYGFILDLIYLQGGYLPDDPRYIAGVLSVSVRKWNSLRSVLIKTGKIKVSGEFLTNYRALIELKKLSKYQDKQRENASGPRKNKGLEKPAPNHTDTDTDTDIKDTNVSLSVSPANDLTESVAIYNAAAEVSAWPQVQKITPSRSKQIRARLQECGGVEGWRIAVEKAQASDFICARTPKPWTGFSFDWLIKSQNFTKLMEGNYDNRGNNHQPPQRPQDRPDPALEQIARLAGLGEASGNGGR
ncbi:MAG: DUF1376 domain-containing protein [Pikeienuella sp.]